MRTIPENRKLDFSDYIEQGILFLNAKGEICIWNNWLENHSGMKKEKVLGRRLDDVFPNLKDQFLFSPKRISAGKDGSADLSPILHGRYIPVNPSQNPGRTENRFVYQRAQSHVVTFDESSQGLLVLINNVLDPVFQDKFSAKGLEKINKNIQELEATRNLLEEKAKALELSNKYKSEFLANLSHEIRTPMNGIVGFTELLLEGELTEEQHRFLEIIKVSSDNLMDLLNDILDLSKIEAGRFELESVPINFQNLVIELNELNRSKLNGKRIELICDVDQSIPSLLGDSIRLRQILSNLIGNAVKFTDEGEIVTKVMKLSETFDATDVKISIRDTGIGISMENLKTIFEAFIQGDGSTTRKHGGTGLGLTICKKLIELMDGNISVESDFNKGTTFSIQLSMKNNHQPLEEIQATPGPKLAGLQCLIVDDNPTFLRVLSEMISFLGMSPIEAENGRQGLDHLKQTPFDLIVTDIYMPEMDGFEFFAKAKEMESKGDLKFIATTGDHNKETVKKIKQLGFDHCLYKPFSTDSFLAAVNKVVSLGHKKRDKLGGAFQEMRKANGRKVLLAEDNPINRKLTVEILSKLGFEFDTVTNGRDAVLKARSVNYDLILMDVQMPKLGGCEATQQLRKSGIRCPIIALTAHAMKGDKERCIEAGMDDYISRPVKLDRFEKVISKYCPVSPKTDILYRKRVLTVSDNIDSLRMICELFKDKFPWISLKTTNFSDYSRQTLESFVPHLIILFVSDSMSEREKIEALSSLIPGGESFHLDSLVLTDSLTAEREICRFREMGVSTFLSMNGIDWKDKLVCTIEEHLQIEAITYENH